MNLKQNLLDYIPSSSREIIVKKKMLAFLESYDNCFHRELEIGHFTASAFLLDSTKQKFLLLHHKKLHIWTQPGGHTDGNTNLLEVAIRETQEETGIEDITPIFKDIFEIEIYKIPKFQKEEEHLHFDVKFLLKTTSNNNFSINHESNDINWFDLHDLSTIKHLSLSSSIIKMAKRARKLC